MEVALNDIKETLELVKMINVAIRRAKTHAVNIRYGRIPGFKPIAERSAHEEIIGLRIFTFVGAGFYSLRGGRSVEASLVLCGRGISRDGSIACVGSVIYSYSRCISRCVRPTLAAEAVACDSSIEVGLWHRALLSEIMFGFFFLSRCHMRACVSCIFP